MNHRVRLLGWAVMLCVVFSAESPGAFRKVLAELFTSTTCGPCYAADVFYFENWLPNYGGADQVITLAYHVWWPAPGNDPLYAANPAPVQAREAYYRPAGGSYAPRMMVDGFIDAGFQYSSWPGAIEPRFLDASPIAITLSGTRNGTTLDLSASIYAEQAVTSSAWRVHWVIVESGLSVPQYNGSAYVPFTHNYVHRGMSPDGNGSPITISQGQTVVIPRTLTLGTGWVPENCKVIVFVQNNTDKKVQNAEVISVDMLTAVGEGPGEAPQVFALEQNYPNPFNGETRIGYRVPAMGDGGWVTLRVYDLLGQEVATLVNEQKQAGTYSVAFDASGLPSGVYCYHLTAGAQQETRRMLLMK
jgi:hypothetical protein